MCFYEEMRPDNSLLPGLSGCSSAFWATILSEIVMKFAGKREARPEGEFGAPYPAPAGGEPAAMAAAVTGVTGACGAKPENGPTGCSDWRAASATRTGEQ